MSRIFFHEVGVFSGLRDRTLLKEFISRMFKKEKIPLGRVDVIFGSDEYVRKLNKIHLGHNYYTDTLSFTLSLPGQPVIGELYLSIDRIRDNARELDLPYREELARVIIHSCLHLMGYRDNSKSAALRMNKTQEAYLRHWNVSREKAKRG